MKDTDRFDYEISVIVKNRRTGKTVLDAAGEGAHALGVGNVLRSIGQELAMGTVILDERGVEDVPYDAEAERKVFGDGPLAFTVGPA